MIALESTKTQVLVEPSARTKLQQLPSVIEDLLRGSAIAVPENPGRDVQICAIRELPPKKGLSLREGQARLLHDLGSIELQAMELAVRTLVEFGEEAPREFREQLAEIALEEGLHLRLCLDGLDNLGMPWGSFPTHLGLWQSVSREDSLLDRVLIVHRYLEGSGLDASDQILNRLSGVPDARAALTAVRVIRRDEVRHVAFGSKWYHQLARAAGLDPADDFRRRLDSLFHRIPRRLEPVREDLRALAGFTPDEIVALQELRLRLMAPGDRRIHAKLQEGSL